MISRQEEIRVLLKLSVEEIISKSKEHLLICNTLEELHIQMAKDIFSEIKENNHQKKRTILILPIGPTGQYPYLIKLLQKNPINLSQLWIFFMDEYCDDNGIVFDLNHPLSFKGIAKMLFLSQIPNACKFNIEHLYFPDQNNIHEIPQKIHSLGGIDTCYGGIGIHGHVAFNEPEKNVVSKTCRKISLNRYTITINAIRANVGGNLENFPKFAYTIGMKQILEAKRIRLYCRNGSEYDWANTVLRLALLGTPGDDYPVTHIRKHNNYQIITDLETIRSPKYLI